jgi:hypothetical protein
MDDKSIATDYIDFSRNNLIRNVVPFQQIDGSDSRINYGQTHDMILGKIL